MKQVSDYLIDWFGISKNTEEYKWSKTATYQKRVGIIKNTWIAAGLVMLTVAQPAFIVGLGLFVVFLSFAYLEKE